ncbi:SDR family oxidoreductase (plasmid) [Sphingomonas paeninsulae]|uniref:SDR family oxidoreductase n=1 Tax=Sphingomonas paeninsulae TaxID=2319844 RepID=A0A494THH3_SPHPE|nr:SDR family NAD(P)-dependent oxidoreductase [Sphingomonas paeninsulae]AYJ84878.1 SDR family oxidoreductase [Sphingomonas paeninsulae]
MVFCEASIQYADYRENSGCHGGGMGIGRASALRLARDGAHVAVIDRDADAIVEVVDAIGAAGGHAFAAIADLLDTKAITDVFARIEADLGPVDVLVNNVGQSARERAKPFWEGDPEIWDFTLGISLRSTMVCTRQVINGMRERRLGRIINMSSESAFYGHELTIDYSAAKAGVLGFTRALAGALAPCQITVNAICPGLVRTRVMDQLPADHIQNMAAAIPMGYIGEPDDIAAAVSFFASEGSRFITGQSLLVNGGKWMI